MICRAFRTANGTQRISGSGHRARCAAQVTSFLQEKPAGLAAAPLPAALVALPLRILVQSFCRMLKGISGVNDSCTVTPGGI
jgi:hypothetical protein